MKNLCIGCENGLLREGLESLCRQTGDIQSVVSVSTSTELGQVLEDKEFDVLLIDPETFIFMYNQSNQFTGKPLLHIKESYESLLILAFADNSDYAKLRPYLAQGYDGFVFLNRSFSEAVYAIQAVSRGVLYIPTEAAESFIQENSVYNSESLTHRETEVLKLIGLGDSSKEIAFKLGIAVSTVDVHRKKLLRKVGTSSAAGLIRFAIKSGLVPL
ncbi:MAG: response regulator transcription factor [Spirochaetia bacterium]|nr:response regulator transcription factor [Spirochaetia bacterium]